MRSSITSRRLGYRRDIHGGNIPLDLSVALLNLPGASGTGVALWHPLYSVMTLDGSNGISGMTDAWNLNDLSQPNILLRPVWNAGTGYIEGGATKSLRLAINEAANDWTFFWSYNQLAVGLQYQIMFETWNGVKQVDNYISHVFNDDIGYNDGTNIIWGASRVLGKQTLVYTFKAPNLGSIHRDSDALLVNQNCVQVGLDSSTAGGVMNYKDGDWGVDGNLRCGIIYAGALSDSDRAYVVGLLAADRP